MKLWQSIKDLFTPPPAGPQVRSHSASNTAPNTAPNTDLDVGPQPEPENAPVPELEPAQVQKALAGALPPLLLDVREGYEWREVRIPAALHIPMNSVPDRLDELPRSRAIVVVCAHGSRSYGVAHYLREQGFDAASLQGGITRWRIEGGPVNVG